MKTTAAETNETFRGRIYHGEAMTMDRAMMYASANGGLSGECIRVWPAAYLATHPICEEGISDDAHGRVEAMGTTTARAVKGLLSKGWIERKEKTIEVPADNDRFSMFSGMPAHTVILVHYHATDKGRAAWSKCAA
jgi:hypothetical protein